MLNDIQAYACTGIFVNVHVFCIVYELHNFYIFSNKLHFAFLCRLLLMLQFSNYTYIHTCVCVCVCECECVCVCVCVCECLCVCVCVCVYSVCEVFLDQVKKSTPT